MVYALPTLLESEERARYTQHNNSIDDPGYCAFLGRLLRPLIERIPPGARGLDFGCGPGPTLSEMIRQRGFDVVDYDPVFYPDLTASPPFDFVTATEVVEHFKEPAGDFESLFALVRPGGIVGITTSLLPERADWSTWYYFRDLTHTSFYSEQTFEWIAGRWGLRRMFGDDGVWVFRKG